MLRIIRLIAIGGLLAALLPAPHGHAQSAPPVINEILIEGNQRIEDGTIRSYLLIQEGDRLDPKRVDRSLKSLFATGLFADVTIRRDGGALVVVVVENPVINRIAFEGNLRIDDEVLRAEVTLRPRVVFTRTKVQKDVQRILNIYRVNGRFAATVDPKFIRQPQNRADLVFEIDEGPLTQIRKIRFIGNRANKDSKLRSVIRTKESAFYRFFSSDDTYDPDRLTLDRELLKGCLEQIPALQREAIQLAYFEGYTQREIAELIAIPLGTVKGRIRIGMEKLRHLLREMELGGSRDEPR